MIKKILIALCAVIISFSACDTIKKVDESMLKNSWTHVYEEDTDGIKIFKPTHSQEFAPSRYRLVLNLKENNQAEYLVLSPNDAHYMEKGTWHYNTDTQQLAIKDNNNNTIHMYEVLEVTDNLLRVKQLVM